MSTTGGTVSLGTVFCCALLLACGDGESGSGGGGAGGWLNLTSTFGPGETNETTLAVTSAEVPLTVRLFP